MEKVAKGRSSKAALPKRARQVTASVGEGFRLPQIRYQLYGSGKSIGRKGYAVQLYQPREHWKWEEKANSKIMEEKRRNHMIIRFYPRKASDPEASNAKHKYKPQWHNP